MSVVNIQKRNANIQVSVLNIRVPFAFPDFFFRISNSFQNLPASLHQKTMM